MSKNNFGSCQFRRRGTGRWTTYLSKKNDFSVNFDPHVFALLSQYAKCFCRFGLKEGFRFSLSNKMSLSFIRVELIFDKKSKKIGKKNYCYTFLKNILFFCRGLHFECCLYLFLEYNF
jgi:hypothetical protein